MIHEPGCTGTKPETLCEGCLEGLKLKVKEHEKILTELRKIGPAVSDSIDIIQGKKKYNPHHDDFMPCECHPDGS